MKHKLAFALFLLSFITVYAQAKNSITEIDVDVVIRDDGSAYVTQVWNGVFSEGTENYIPINTKGIEISDFKVSDINGEYTFVSKWNVDGTFKEKSRKCGINKVDGGIELCFGISEYGTNRYAIEYIVKNFINSYTDYDGTNFMFINPNMNTFPTDGKISLVLANGEKLGESNARIWGFGYNGQIEFQDGKVVAYTENALKGDNSMIVMLRLDKGIITPQKSIDKSFEEVKSKAMEGSDYDNNNDLPNWVVNLILIGFLAVLSLIIITIINAIKRKLDLKKFYKNTKYFRGVPNKGDLSTSYYLSKTFDVAKDESLIIGATLLSMMNKRHIEPITQEKVNFIGKSKTQISLELVSQPQDVMEKRLYHILVKAAGEDGILQEKELAKYTEKHPSLLRNFINDSHGKGGGNLKRLNGFAKNGGNALKDLSDYGKEQLAEVMGLKKYLLDFSLISEREAQEIIIWQDYMIYATLFGIADRVLKQFKKVYPDKIVEFDDYNTNVIIIYSYYRTMYKSVVSAEQAERSQGLGGSSSIGGGGGFSGGGSGGGSR